MCEDKAKASVFEVVSYSATDDMLILYGCIEMTDMVKDLLDDAVPIVMDLVKNVLQLDLPSFIMEIFTDSIMRILMSNLKIAHMSWHEVLSPNRPLTRS